MDFVFHCRYNRFWISDICVRWWFDYTALATRFRKDFTELKIIPRLRNKRILCFNVVLISWCNHKTCVIRNTIIFRINFVISRMTERCRSYNGFNVNPIKRWPFYYNSVIFNIVWLQMSAYQYRAVNNKRKHTVASRLINAYITSHNIKSKMSAVCKFQIFRHNLTARKIGNCSCRICNTLAVSSWYKHICLFYKFKFVKFRHFFNIARPKFMVVRQHKEYICFKSPIRWAVCIIMLCHKKIWIIVSDR